MSYAQYLALEGESQVKHEYVNGLVYAMSGGTPEHGALALEFARVLGNALTGRPCRLFSSDVRVRIEATSTSTYPDLSVVCGKLEMSPSDPDAITNPVVLVEVLSKTSEACDRGAKANHYRRITSLKEFVLVSQEEKRIEVQRLNAQGLWELRFFDAGEHVELASLNVRLAVDAVYANPLPQ